MTDEKKVYRTAAFRADRDGVEHVLLWALHTSYWNAPKVFITEYDVYPKGSTSKPITQEMPLRDALKQIAALERDAACKYPVADDTHILARWVPEDCRNGPSWSEHPELRVQQAEETIQRLKSRKPPGFGLK
jgi:hypothetical protein